MNPKKLQEKHLEILGRNKCFEFTDTFFPYTSGRIGPYYIESAAVMDDRKNGYVEAVKDMCEMVSNVMESRGIEDHIISGGESRDWIFSFPVAVNLKKPHAMIYKDGKAIGANMSDRYVTHVADLNNEGSSVKNLWIPTIKRECGKIEEVFFYVDRMEGGVQVIKDLNLKSHSLVKLNENAWNYLQRIEVVDEKVYKNLMERMEDKEEWAIKMLRSEKGFERLCNFMSNGEKGREKVDKILRIGYPDIRLELIERLKTDLSLCRICQNSIARAHRGNRIVCGCLGTGGKCHPTSQTSTHIQYKPRLQRCLSKLALPYLVLL